MDVDIADPGRLREALLAQLPQAARAALDRIVGAGARQGGVYAVGGALRDLLLRRPVVDLDLATEGDAIEIVRAALPGERVTAHSRFRTASFRVGGTRIDVVTCRSERYSRPGALPQVAPAGIEEDLRRRDFSVNAMALRLDGDAALLDPCGGAADVETKRIRVLHDGSFADDATRIFRAFRYAARLDFGVEPHTRRLLSAGVSYVATISGDRLRRELELILDEAAAAAALTQCHEAGALRAVHPALRWDETAAAALDGPIAVHAPRRQLGFALLAVAATPEDAASICARLKLRRADAAAATGIASLRGVSAMLRRKDAKPSGVAVLLDRYPPASVAAFAATESDPIAAQLALRYLAEWRHEKPILGGRDLQALGVPAGPQIQRGLQLIRAARLDGWAADRDDERALIARFARSIRDSDAATSDVALDLHGG